MFQHARQNANEKEERQNMLGLFKRMLSKQEAPQTAPPVAPMPVAPPKASPALARVVVPTPRATVPVRVQLKPAPSSGEQREVSPPPASSTHVQVSLAAIAASLPEAISHKVPANPEQFVAIPVDRVLPQLAQGQVVMTAAELRECAPEYLAALAGHDDVEITLPLGDIIKQLSAEHFGRRSQRRLEVPSEVAPVFGGGNGASIAKPSAVQPTPAPRSYPTITATTPSPAPAAVPAQPAKISMSMQGLASLNAKPTTPSSSAASPAVKPIVPAFPPAFDPAKGFSRPPTMVTKKASSARPKVTGHLKVPLAAVCADWMVEVRAQLGEVDVAQSEILVPLELLEPAMRSGRVLFSWQEVAGWIQPPLAIPPTPKVGEMPVELSLKVIAPLFMSNHRGVAQKRLAVDDAIPDLFAGGDRNALVQIAPPAQPPVPSAPAVAAPRVTAPSAPTIPAPRMPTAPAQPEPVKITPAVAPVSVAPAPAAPVAPAVPAAAQISVEQIIGNATSRCGPKEIVARASKLSGVTGALLPMSDGLLVTSHLAPELKGETIAAFLPQMFGRMNQYTKELGLGSLERLTLSVESGEWQVFKCPDIYFAVLGKRGEALPLNLLAQVAAELSSQSK